MHRQSISPFLQRGEKEKRGWEEIRRMEEKKRKGKKPGGMGKKKKCWSNGFKPADAHSINNIALIPNFKHTDRPTD